MLLVCQPTAGAWPAGAKRLVSAAKPAAGGGARGRELAERLDQDHLSARGHRQRDAAGGRELDVGDNRAAAIGADDPHAAVAGDREARAGDGEVPEMRGTGTERDTGGGERRRRLR